MSSSDDDEPQVPVMRVVHARSGADFEAARGGRPRGEHIEGVDVVDPRLPDNGRAGSSGGGAGSSSGGGQQRERQRSQALEKRSLEQALARLDVDVLQPWVRHFLSLLV